MTDPVSVTALIIAAIPATIASLLTAVMTVLTFLKADKVVKVAETTHDLVNGSMLIQLKLHAKTARSKADITGDKVDLAVAALAEKMLDEHQVKLDILDDLRNKSDALPK